VCVGWERDGSAAAERVLQLARARQSSSGQPINLRSPRAPLVSSKPGAAAAQIMGTRPAHNRPNPSDDLFYYFFFFFGTCIPPRLNVCVINIVLTIDGRRRDVLIIIIVVVIIIIIKPDDCNGTGWSDRGTGRAISFAYNNALSFIRRGRTPRRFIHEKHARAAVFRFVRAVRSTRGLLLLLYRTIRTSHGTARIISWNYYLLRFIRRDLGFLRGIHVDRRVVKVRAR